MANPLSGLKPALEVLAHNMDILPATGQAVEDLMRPDQEEVDDENLNPDARQVDTRIEAPSHDLYRPTPSLPRTERHFFRYFLDGSRRSYFIGTALERDRSTPVQVAQVGAAIVERRDNGTVHQFDSDHKLMLLLAKNQISDHIWQQLEALKSDYVLLEDTTKDDQLNGPFTDNVDLRYRGAGKVNWRMHLTEVNLANSLPNRDGDNWLIVDGSLNFDPPINTSKVIGVAKSFSQRSEFTIGRGPRAHTYTLHRLLAGLPAAHRTCAFATRSGRSAFWYLRLREQAEVDYPLMGVVKVELRNPSGEAIPSDQIDLISRALVAERHVTPHGRDSRWHVHLYPIYLAEQVIKNGFLSQEVIRSAIRWPMLMQTSARRLA